VNDESGLLNGQKTIAKFGHADGNRLKMKDLLYFKIFISQLLILKEYFESFSI
jgi:hypothetical protein